MDSTVAPAWVEEALRLIARSDRTEIVITYTNGEKRTPFRPSKIRRFLSQILYRVYERVDRRVFRGNPDAFEARDVSDLLGNRVLEVTPIRRGFIHRFDPSSIQRLIDAHLDVLIRFGFNILKGEILDTARFGVWSYHHGDNRLFRGGPPFFWEMSERLDTTGITLQVLSEDLDGGHVIYRSTSATDFASLNRGRNAAYWKGAQFLTRCLHDLGREGARFLDNRAHLQPRLAYDRGLYRTPGNLQMLLFLTKTVAYWAKRVGQRLLWSEQWVLATRRRSGSEAFSSDPFVIQQPPRGISFADPFVFEDPPSAHIAFERFQGPQGRGEIWGASIDNAGISMSEPQRVLALDHHISYPCTWNEGDEIYLLPESFDSEEIVLYRAEELFGEWERHAALLSKVRAVDPSIFRWKGSYWLFCNIALRGMSPNDELHAFRAAQIEGPWEPHVGNPVISDVTSSRPAGSPFVLDGTLIRPSQDCSVAYGRAIRFFAVEHLDLERYEEIEVGTLDPPKGSSFSGAHTYNRSANLEVIDLRLLNRRWGPRRKMQGASVLPVMDIRIG